MRGMWAAAIGAMAVAAAAAVVTQGPPAPRQVRLTLGEGTSMAAALSPDGRTVAIDLLGALWTYEAAGGPARRILEDGYDARLPVWSPDGRRLAFQAYHRDTWHVWIVDADGGGLQQVTFGPFDDREPFWSPDGTRLAFSSDRSGQYDIWIAALASGEVTRLTTGPANESMPAWSPDGREIAFVSDRQPRGIYAQPVSGGAERRLVEDPSAVAAPAWAPDGNSVAYTTIDGAVARLIVGGKNIAEPTEDLFPFRPQFVAGGDVLYTADGVVKRRPVAGGAAAFAAVHRGDRLHPGAVHAEGPALCRGRPAAGARPDAPGDLARRRPHRLCRARRLVAPRRRRGRERRARAPDPGRLRRDQPGVVARRPGTRLLVGSRRRGRLVDSRSAHRPRSPRRRQRHHRLVVARRRPARLPRHRIDAAGRRRGVARRAPGARSDLRARASELVARRPGRGDVGAAALFLALPRGHQPGAVGRRRARDHGGGEGRVPRRSLVRPGAAPVGGHARELRPGLGAQRPGDGGHRRRLADHLPGVPRRHANRAAAAGQRGPGQLAVVDRRLAPDPLPGRRPVPAGDAGRRERARHHAGVVVDAAPHHRHDDGPRRAAVRRPRARTSAPGWTS